MKTIKILSISAFILLLLISSVFANKTKVKISSLAKAKKGTEVTITISVEHNGNTSFHYTDWVYLNINGKEQKRWFFDSNKLPSSGNFSLTYTFVIQEDVTIEAKGDCCLHGSAGPDNFKIIAE